MFAVLKQQILIVSIRAHNKADVFYVFYFLLVNNSNFDVYKETIRLLIETMLAWIVHILSFLCR